MQNFTIKSAFKPTGDQPQAIEALSLGIKEGQKFQTLLGVTGSGKTFTLANVIERVQKPTLVISHNKTLAWQLYQEFKEFFPRNEVHYFVSYYDYYQPEAYLPQTDTYIEKDAKINEAINKLRHAATQAVLTRSDTIIVSSVSCIYNIGDPKEYQKVAVELKTGMISNRRDLSRQLVLMQFSKNQASGIEKIGQLPGTFRPKGETIEINLPSGEHFVRVTFSASTIEKIWHSKDGPINDFTIFPAKHFITPEEKLGLAGVNIETELKTEIKKLRKNKKILEAARLEQRTYYDLEMMRETGYCSGIENYSRHLSFRKPGEAPYTLLDFFPKGFLAIADESHMTIPQLRGMYNGDRARKEVLVEHGFRLPSSLDNRPLKLAEWEQKVPQVIFVSATPGMYELTHSQNKLKRFVTEQILRPTHVLDPKVIVRPTANQISNALYEIKNRIKLGQRTLITVITKRLAEDLAEHLAGAGIKAAHLHSEIKTLNRPEILNDLRAGKIDVVVGVNLLREGLDLPEVSLVLIFDADKEGFLRNETTLIQTAGRAARHINGQVIMYADRVTNSITTAVEETRRRRLAQEKYNREHNLKPKTIAKKLRSLEIVAEPEKIWLRAKSKRELEQELKQAVKKWDFEKAIVVRDYLKSLQK